MKCHEPVSITLCLLLSVACTSQSPGQTQQKRSLADRGYKRAILQRVDSLLENQYVIAEKAAGFAAAFRRKYAAGVYDSLNDATRLAESVSADLQSITHDSHVTVRAIASSDVGEKAESNLHHPVRYYRIRMREHTGFTKLEWFEGGIGYLELRRFNHLSEAREMLDIAMRFLEGANAIIVDLRENGGGSGDYLSSYFLPHPTQLTGTYYREGNELQEAWTSGNIDAERMLDVPLFVLTSRKTFSAAESFAYDMKVRKRAILVGDSTRGGAHDVGYFKLDDQFEMYLSIGRAVNPVTQTNWEGVGVIPDVLVPARAALDSAHALAKKAAAEFSRKNDDHLKRGVERMEVHLARAEQWYRENRTVEAKEALDSVIQIGGELGLITEFFMNVLAYNYYSDRSENILFAVLKRSTEIFPQSSTAFETLASAYHDFGKEELARVYYRKVLELDPDNAHAQKRLKGLTEKD